MESWRRTGSFRQRAKNSERLTRQLREMQSQNVIVRMNDSIRDFEENLRLTRAAQDVDDLPFEAEPIQSRNRRWHQQPAWQQDAGSDASSVQRMLHRTQSDGMMTRGSLSGAQQSSTMDRHEAVHTERPPSPVNFYDYGCISVRPRSCHSQRINKYGGSARPKCRQGNRGVYFPGADMKQGPDGFSLQDTILYPPRSWRGAHDGTGPGERFKDASMLRPATAEGRDKPRSQNPNWTGAGVPSAPEPYVRQNNVQDTKSRHVGNTLDKVRDEAFLEQVRFESGMFDGKWRDPMLDRVALVHEEPRPGYGDEAEVTKDLAIRLFLAIEQVRVEHKSTLAHLFRSVNRGVVGVLEATEFIEGLEKLHIIDQGELSIDDVSKVAALTDPEFDGRINLPALSKSISAAKFWHAQKTQAYGKNDLTNKKQTFTYGKSLPVEIVKVDRAPRSVCDFQRSFEKFRQQQESLLFLHKESAEL
eukprot:TRINITY_DN96255_c0_g1_i1.p1 TRINITY_DN96255_c0_g1~~TRINITY_DN96255_c0_g1_i1.p1  ORF type:complete len:473 (+),score=63.92 TRINITY_DN96255_c0_g1_i1:61-1479(+)